MRCFSRVLGTWLAFPSVAAVAAAPSVIQFGQVVTADWLNGLCRAALQSWVAPNSAGQIVLPAVGDVSGATTWTGLPSSKQPPTIANGIYLQGRLTGMNLSGATGVPTGEAQTTLADFASQTDNTSVPAIFYGVQCNGVTDDGPAIQRAHDLSGSRSTLLMPEGVCLVNTAVLITHRMTIKGVGWSVTGGSLTGSAISTTIPTVTPFSFSGEAASGSVLQDLAFEQTQPADATGWTPIQYAPSVSVVISTYGGQEGHQDGEFTARNLLFLGVYQGLYIDRTAHVDIDAIHGDTYGYLVSLHHLLDYSRIGWIHQWNYYVALNGLQPNRSLYQERNDDALIIGRADQLKAQMVDCYSCRSVVRLEGDPELPLEGGGMSTGLGGSANQLYLGRVNGDVVMHAVYADSTTIRSGVVIDSINSIGLDNQSLDGEPLPGADALEDAGNGNKFQIGQISCATNDARCISYSGTTNGGHYTIGRFFSGSMRGNVFGSAMGLKSNNILQFATAPLNYLEDGSGLGPIIEANSPVTVYSLPGPSGVFTVATLPAAARNTRLSVSDAMTCTFHGTLTGGGSTFCPVIYDGFTWVAE